MPSHPHRGRLSAPLAAVDRLWTSTTGGIPGNDDAGTLSAWYVFSALGLYPFVRAAPTWC